MLSCLTLSLALAVPAADDPKAVVEKAITAHGGADVLAKYKAHRAKFRGTVHSMGMDVEMTGELWTVDPDKVKLKATVTVAGMELPLVHVLNGSKLSVSIAGNAFPVPDEQVQDGLDNLYVAHLSRLVTLLEPGFTLKAADPTDVDGKPAVGIAVSHADKPDVTLHFDAASGLLVRSSRKGKAEDGSDAEKVSFYAEYKAIKGLQVPHRARATTAGKQTEDFKLDSYEPLESLPASEFEAD